MQPTPNMPNLSPPAGVVQSSQPAQPVHPVVPTEQTHPQADVYAAEAAQGQPQAVQAQPQAAPAAQATQQAQPAAAAPAGFTRNLLPTKAKRTKIELSDQAILLYGPPKIGKTTLASQFPKPLFLPTEPGQGNLEVFSTPVCLSWDQVAACIQEMAASIQARDFDFQTIVIDTVDNLWQFACDAVAREANVQTIGDIGGYGKGYALAGAKIRQLIQWIMAQGLGVIFIGHSRTREETDAAGKFSKQTLELSASASAIFTKAFDLILYMAPLTEIDEHGNVLENRACYCRESRYHLAGDRTGRLPSGFRLPSDSSQMYAALQAAYVGQA